MKPQSVYFHLQCAVLGACLLESSAFQRVDGVITPTHFQLGFNKVLAAMQNLHDAAKPITIIDVPKAMSNGLEENKRNFAAMAHMLTHVSSTAYLEHHAISLIETYWCNTAKAALPNAKSIHNLELAQDILELDETISDPACDILDVLPKAVKKFEVFYANDLHVVKALLQTASDMSEDIFRIKESLTQKGWYGAAKIQGQDALSARSASEMHTPSEELRYNKSKKGSTINEEKPRLYNRKPPIEEQKDMPF